MTSIMSISSSSLRLKQMLFDLSELKAYSTPIKECPHMFKYSSIVFGKFGMQMKSGLRGKKRSMMP